MGEFLLRFDPSSPSWTLILTTTNPLSCSNNRLTANRALRVRKICAYVRTGVLTLSLSSRPYSLSHLPPPPWACPLPH